MMVKRLEEMEERKIDGKAIYSTKGAAREYGRVNKLEGVEFINYTMKPSLHFSDYKSGQYNRGERRARERKEGKR